MDVAVAAVDIIGADIVGFHVEYLLVAAFVGTVAMDAVVVLVVAEVVVAVAESLGAVGEVVEGAAVELLAAAEIAVVEVAA